MAKIKKKVIEEFSSLIPYPDREIGIEIEMEGRGLVKGPSGWKTTTDGSLRGESLEYVLSKPVSEEDSYILLDRLQKHLSDHKAELTPSDRCGVHIHINVQDMNVDDVIKFCTLYLVLEDILVEWCGEDREGNLFCLRAQDAEYIVKALLQAKQEGTFKRVVDWDIRYASMNITSLAKYGSLEFRAMRTPKDFNRIKTWIKMLLAIKKASNSYNSTEEIIEYVSLRGGRQFVRSIFGELSSEFPITRLNDKIIEAARRAQDVAYAERWKPKKKQGIENLSYSYWYGLKRARRWCAERNFKFIKWDAPNHALHFIFEDGSIAEPTDWWMESQAEVDTFDWDTLDLSHQHDDILISNYLYKTGVERQPTQIQGMPGIPQPDFEEDGGWIDEPEEEYIEDEEPE